MRHSLVIVMCRSRGCEVACAVLGKGKREIGAEKVDI